MSRIRCHVFSQIRLKMIVKQKNNFIFIFKKVREL